MIKPEQSFNEEKLRALLASLFLPSKVPVYKANSQVDTTKTPFYLTVQQVTSTAQGYSTKYDGDSETEYSLVKSNVLFSVQIIGKGALAWANRLQPSLRLSSVLDQLKNMKVGILQISAIRDLSGAFDAGYEERSQFDLLMSITTIVKEQLNAVHSVELKPNIKQ